MRAATRGVSDLATLRRHVQWLLVGAASLAAVLVAVHPAWVLGAPALVAGAFLAGRPTYRQRRARAVACTRAGIPLTTTGG